MGYDGEYLGDDLTKFKMKAAGDDWDVAHGVFGLIIAHLFS